MQFKFIFLLLLMSLLIMSTGCDYFKSGSDSSESRRDMDREVDHAAAFEEAMANVNRLVEGAGGATPPAGSGGPVNNSLAGVTFLHRNVSSWPITANLSPVRISGGNIVLNYNKANVWPGVDTAGATVNANPWILINRGGKWYAATFEWLRPGQTSKPIRTVNGDHIKASPLNDFVPVSGERYGFFVSGLARGNATNVKERSNIQWLVWP